MALYRKILPFAVSLFLLSEALLGYFLQTADGTIVPTLQFSAVLLACAFCAVFAERSLAYLFTQVALLCTVGADWFLVMQQPPQQLFGMLFFSVVQISYFLRLFLDDKNRTRRIVHLCVRLALSAAALAATALVLRENADAVALVSMFYYANLLLNVVFAWIEAERPFLFPIALSLFAVCDAVIGLGFLGDYIALADAAWLDRLIHPGFDLAWACYLTAQALLAISLLPRRIRARLP